MRGLGGKQPAFASCLTACLHASSSQRALPEMTPVQPVALILPSCHLPLRACRAGKMAAQQVEVCLTMACQSPVVWTDEQVRRPARQGVAGCSCKIRLLPFYPSPAALSSGKQAFRTQGTLS